MQKKIDFLTEENQHLEREAEDKKEETKKLVMQLQNYEVEFEKLQKMSKTVSQDGSQNTGELKEELDELKRRNNKLQQEKMEEKEKCIDLDLKLGQLNVDLQNLML